MTICDNCKKELDVKQQLVLSREMQATYYPMQRFAIKVFDICPDCMSAFETRAKQSSITTFFPDFPKPPPLPKS